MLISSLWFIPFFHFHPIFWLISLFLYFLPAFLAGNKPNFTSILILNILAGWTFIGWIIALVWALSSDSQQRVAAPVQATQPAEAFFARLAVSPAQPERVFAVPVTPPNLPPPADGTAFERCRLRCREPRYDKVEEVFRVGLQAYLGVG